MWAPASSSDPRSTSVLSSAPFSATLLGPPQGPAHIMQSCTRWPACASGHCALWDQLSRDFLRPETVKSTMRHSKHICHSFLVRITLLLFLSCTQSLHFPLKYLKLCLTKLPSCTPAQPHQCPSRAFPARAPANLKALPSASHAPPPSPNGGWHEMCLPRLAQLKLGGSLVVYQAIKCRKV